MFVIDNLLDIFSLFTFLSVASQETSYKLISTKSTPRGIVFTFRILDSDILSPDRAPCHWERSKGNQKQDRKR